MALQRASSKANLAGVSKPRRHTLNPELRSAGSDGTAGPRHGSEPLAPGESLHTPVHSLGPLDTETVCHRGQALQLTTAMTVLHTQVDTPNQDALRAEHNRGYSVATRATSGAFLLSIGGRGHAQVTAAPAT